MEYAPVHSFLVMHSGSIFVKSYLKVTLETQRPKGRARGTARSADLRLPPLPPGLEVYRPADVLGSSVLVVEDEAAMQQQLRIDLQDLGYRPSVAASAPGARERPHRGRR